MLSFEEAEAYLRELPTSKYMHTLRELHLSENALKMLRANYAAPNSTLTAKQMASRVGYKNFGAANIHYGKLGRRVANALGVSLESPILSLITMDWPTGECEWTLRVQLSETLEQLGIVNLDNKTNPAHAEQDWLREGKVSQTVANVYERNATARRLCIEHYGTSCYICNFS